MNGRIILSSVDPPIRRGNRQVFVPGYGPVETVTPADPFWKMRSFKIVDVTDKVTHRTTPADRKFELHVAIRVETEKRRPTRVSGASMSAAATWRSPPTPPAR